MTDTTRLTIEETERAISRLSSNPKPIGHELLPVYRQLLAVMQENERQKRELEVFAEHLSRTLGRSGMLQEALEMIEMVETNLGDSIVYSVRCENPKEFMLKRAAALKGNGMSS